MRHDTPSRLIDRTDGTVLLRLVPFYLARLHGSDDRADPDHVLGLPFPFLRAAKDIDVVLRHGMTTAAIAEFGGGFEPNSSLGATSWWRWASYALTPFGWVAHPTPFFTDGRLSSVSLRRHGGTPEENFAAIDDWMRREIGAPAAPIEPRSRSWTFCWGAVALAFEPRDGDAELGIWWGTATGGRRR